MKEINSSGGHAIGISTDVSSPPSVKNAFEQIKKDFKGKQLSAAVFNVGGSFVKKPFLEMSLEEYEGGYAANGYVILLFLSIVTNVSVEKVSFSSPKRLSRFF